MSTLRRFPLLQEFSDDDLEHLGRREVMRPALQRRAQLAVRARPARREPEIHEPGAAGGIEQHVLWLEVAVNQLSLVHVANGGADLSRVEFCS